jgi:hypothetical protein
MPDRYAPALLLDVFAFRFVLRWLFPRRLVLLFGRLLILMMVVGTLGALAVMGAASPVPYLRITRPRTYAPNPYPTVVTPRQSVRDRDSMRAAHRDARRRRSARHAERRTLREGRAGTRRRRRLGPRRSVLPHPTADRTRCGSVVAGRARAARRAASSRPDARTLVARARRTRARRDPSGTSRGRLRRSAFGRRNRAPTSEGPRRPAAREATTRGLVANQASVSGQLQPRKRASAELGAANAGLVAASPERLHYCAVTVYSPPVGKR